MLITVPAFLALVALGFSYLLRCVPHPHTYNFPPVNVVLPPLTKLNYNDYVVKTIPDVLGAESFTEDPETGDIYTGAANGTIYRLRVTKKVSNEIDVSATPIFHDQLKTDTSRILGLKYINNAATNGVPSLIACDAALGLVMIQNIRSSGGPVSLEVLVDEVVDDGRSFPIVFCNSLILSPDQTKVYFTISSDRPLQQLAQEVIEGVPTGRLMSYDLKTKETIILRRHLAFANGLTLSYDESALLVVELMRGRIWQYDLKSGEWASWTVLPFLPDNIQRSNIHGKYLVGGAVWRSKFVEAFLSNSALARKILLIAPDLLLRTLCRVVGTRAGYVAVLDENGHINTLYDGTSVGAAATSEGFLTANNILLWGSFDYSTPLIASVFF